MSARDFFLLMSLYRLSLAATLQHQQQPQHLEDGGDGYGRLSRQTVIFKGESKKRGAKRKNPHIFMAGK